MRHGFCPRDRLHVSASDGPGNYEALEGCQTALTPKGPRLTFPPFPLLARRRRLLGWTGATFAGAAGGALYRFDLNRAMPIRAPDLLGEMARLIGADLNLGLTIENPDGADILARDIAPSAEHRQQAARISIVGPAHIEPEPRAAALAALGPTSRRPLLGPRSAGLIAEAWIGHIFERRKMRAIDADQGTGDVLGRALRDQHPDQVIVAVLGRLVQQRIVQQALGVEAPDLPQRSAARTKPARCPLSPATVRRGEAWDEAPARR